MIGLNVLKNYLYEDISYSILQFIDDFNAAPNKFFLQLQEENEIMDINKCPEGLKIIVALADHLLQINGFDVPKWMRVDVFKMDKALYLSRTGNGFDVARLIAHTPAPFRARNIFINPSSLERV